MGSFAQQSCTRLRVAVGMILVLLSSVAVAQDWRPPPAPQVPPLISEAYPNDADRNGIDDQLDQRAGAVLAALQAARTPEEQAVARRSHDAFVEVELIFRNRVRQEQIAAFQAAGGKLDYMYKAVSYGWNGRIPLGKVRGLAAAMGNGVVLIHDSKPVQLHLDLATRTGRVRPVWATGFAGNPAGFDGDSNITIAVVDSGIDASHPDLAGRQQYWKDFSTDNFASPTDIVQHGSHVSGIAFGTGAAAGAGSGTLYYTAIGDLSAVANGSFNPSPIDLPTSTTTFTSSAVWLGGGSTTLYGVYHPNGTSGGWTAISAGTVGSSPLTESNTLAGVSSNAYSAALLSNGGTVKQYVVTSSVTNYPGIGDGFNKLRGVAPDCRWAAAKVFTNSGSGLTTWTGAAIDDLVANRVVNNIKVMNLSLGTVGNPGIDTATRQKVNTAVKNGIVVCCSAGNDGQGVNANARQTDDPGRAAMALTVAASNDVNQITVYTSHGVTNPGSTAGQEEDYKPDIAAPGGSSAYYTSILSVDSNSGDGSSFADQQPNDYYNIQGTSMASPFAAGCAALVIDALQQAGTTWNFGSQQHSAYVKMILCATATETNANRESGSFNPTLQRAAAGPSGFPAGKDQYEGYGMINPDAAVEAVSLTHTPGSMAGDQLGPSVTDRRAWARRVTLPSSCTFSVLLTVPAGGDFDLYLYSATPSAYGTPVILVSSTNAGSGVNESFNYSPAGPVSGLLVVKRISGSGTFTLSSSAQPNTPENLAADPATICPGQSCTLSASAGSGETVDWFTGSCGGTLAGTGLTLSVSPAATTTYYARARNTTSGCVGAACDTITVTVSGCDDSNACTSDSCHPISGCIHAPISCDDTNACTTDTCDEQSGCQHSAISCDDENACTDDACNPEIGCVHTPVNCDDTNACTTDTCDELSGCQHTAINCDDASACTNDSCNPAIGCVHTLVNCDDANACTADTCDQHSGCQHSAVSCDDENACTDDACNPEIGCVHTPVNCDDTNACTTDTCDELSGCQYTAINCDDASACTSDSCEPELGCVHSPVNCDDGNPATQDSCDPQNGCLHTPICSAPTVLSAVSLKGHGGAAGGPFGIPLGISPSAGSVECRVGGPTSIMVSFDTTILPADGNWDAQTAGAEVFITSSPAGSITVSSVTSSGNELTILLTGVPDRSCMHLTLHGIACDADGSPGPVMPDIILVQRVVLGDTSNNGTVSSADINQTKANVSAILGTGNFRMDTDDNGSISSTDVDQVKANTTAVATVCP